MPDARWLLATTDEMIVASYEAYGDWPAEAGMTGRVTDSDVTTRTCANVMQTVCIWLSSIKPEKESADRAGTTAGPIPREAAPWCETLAAETATGR
jgi:hypothetical protein